jgi:probable rRNA maturation factor
MEAGDDFVSRVERIDILSAELEESLAGRLSEYEEVAVSLFAATDDEIRNLNAKYRHIDEPTDVLSFPLWENDGKFIPPSSWERLPLGDVVISPERVRENSGGEKIGYNNEMALMIIHGVLHLVGFDHDTDERMEEMWGAQRNILSKYLARLTTGED